jgi:signal transduction histidine kinase
MILNTLSLTMDFASALLFSSSDAIALLDSNLRISRHNLKMAELNTAVEPWGISIFDFLPIIRNGIADPEQFFEKEQHSGSIEISKGDGRKGAYNFVYQKIAAGDSYSILLIITDPSKLHPTEDATPPDPDPITESTVRPGICGSPESHVFLNSLLNSAFFGISSYRPILNDRGEITDFTIMYTNEEVPANFGLSVEQVKGYTCRQVYPGLFENGLFELMAAVAITGKTATYELEANPGGNVIWFTAAIEKSGEDIIIISKNITAEKLAALELEKLNTLLENKNKELEHQIIEEFSASFATYTSGKSFFDALILELYRKTNANFILIGRYDADHDVECLSVCKNGAIADNFTYKQEWGPCQLVAEGKPAIIPRDCPGIFPDSELLISHHAEGYIGFPIKDEAGRTMALIAVMSEDEISAHQYIVALLKIAAKRCELEFERDRKEQLLAENYTKLQMQNKELASFTYIASHDLQEPLRKIRMFMSRLMADEDQVFTESSIEKLTGIKKTVDRMQVLIDDLLYYSKAESGPARMKVSDLNFVVHDVLHQMDDLITDKNAVISFGQLPQIRCIGRQVAQVFTNVISNSLKYAHGDRRPEIGISSRRAGESGEYWRIDIEDNGIGFDMRYKNKIFEVFQRLHGRLEYAGTGVGLAICKKIMEQHGGYIDASSRPDKGSVFSLYFKA